MTTIHANVPDYLAKLAEEAAQKENVTVDQIVALALATQVFAWNVRDDIESRAKRGRYGRLGANPFQGSQSCSLGGGRAVKRQLR